MHSTINELRRNADQQRQRARKWEVRMGLAMVALIIELVFGLTDYILDGRLLAQFIWPARLILVVTLVAVIASVMVTDKCLAVHRAAAKDLRNAERNTIK